MEREIKSGFLYGAAGILLILAWLTWFLETPSVLGGLQAVGWVIGASGLVLIFLPMFVLRRKGKAKEGKDWTQTTMMVDSGMLGRGFWVPGHGLRVPDFQARGCGPRCPVRPGLPGVHAVCPGHESAGRDRTAAAPQGDAGKKG